MTLLLDQGLARSTAGLLADAGIQARHIAELDMSRAEDRQILAQARSDEAIVVTTDGDFHAILAETGAPKPSVIRIRIEGLKADGQVQAILRVLGVAAVELEQGEVVTVDEWSVRVRLLPLGRRTTER